MTSVNIFIDDERFPPNDGKQWLICRTSEEAISVVGKNLNKIALISFDHDLGGNDTTRPVVWWMLNEALEGTLHTTFDWRVHSQNPVGARWLREALEDVEYVILWGESV